MRKTKEDFFGKITGRTGKKCDARRSARRLKICAAWGMAFCVGFIPISGYAGERGKETMTKTPGVLSGEDNIYGNSPWTLQGDTSATSGKCLQEIFDRMRKVYGVDFFREEWFAGWSDADIAEAENSFGEMIPEEWRSVWKGFLQKKETDNKKPSESGKKGNTSGVLGSVELSAAYGAASGGETGDSVREGSQQKAVSETKTGQNTAGESNDTKQNTDQPKEQPREPERSAVSAGSEEEEALYDSMEQADSAENSAEDDSVDENSESTTKTEYEETMTDMGGQIPLSRQQISLYPANLEGTAIVAGDQMIVVRIPEEYASDYTLHLYRSRVLRNEAADGEKLVAEYERDVTDLFLNSESFSPQGVAFFSISKLSDEGESNDGLYCLKLEGDDGDSPTFCMDFSVNRFGSVYSVTEDLGRLIEDGGQYVRTEQLENLELGIIEYNPSPFLENTEIILTRDAEPMDALVEVIPGEADIQRDGELSEETGNRWYCRSYILSGDNFLRDGVYRVGVSSDDEAGHRNELLGQSAMNVKFCVDNTAPELVAVSGLEDMVYYEDEHRVEFEFWDAMGIADLVVEIDGEPAEVTLESDGGSYRVSGSFLLEDDTQAQHVNIQAADRAGNRYLSECDTISGKLLVRDVEIRAAGNRFTDDLLTWRKVPALLLVAGALATLACRKRRKNV